jgi:C_GCAxxG_C_C family probable redox protein
MEETPLSQHSMLAKELFGKGYNCSQAVFVAFCDETGLDHDTVLRIASSFGGGMGRLREVCGAVSGMFMAAGMIYGYSDPLDKDAKAKHYQFIQSLAKEFKEENGSIICKELLGLSVKNDGHVAAEKVESSYKKRPCVELVEHAAMILDQYIQNGNMEEKQDAK